MLKPSLQELISKRGDVPAGWSNACFAWVGSEGIFLQNVFPTCWDTFEDKIIIVIESEFFW